MGLKLWLRVAALLPIVALGCGAEPPESAPDPVEVKRGEIASGTDAGQSVSQFYGMAAIYHPDTDDGFTWFPRPCSGTIIYSKDNFSWVLTARHCVTADGTMGGPIAPLSNLRVLPGPNPGLASQNPPAPPAASVQAGGVLAMSPQNDMAIVGVARNWEALVTRFGMWLANPQELVQAQVQFTAFGYGLRTFDTGCFDHMHPVNTGAGVARYGGPFTVVGAGGVNQPNEESSSYQFGNSSPSGQSIICGDSGGGDIASLGAGQGSTWMHLLGVHSVIPSSPNDLAVSQTSVHWLQSQFGGFYLSPDSFGTVPRGLGTGANANVTRFVTGDGVWVVPAPISADRWGYDPFTQRISLGAGSTTCLAPSGGVGSAVVQRACADVPAQRWSFEADRRLVNVALGSCLTTSGQFLSTAVCDDSSPNSWTQMWAFHVQPYEFEAYAYCADENQTCSFSGTKNVRYGANGSYIYRTLTNGAACNNATFGDPIPGVFKSCSIGPKGFTNCANQNGTCTFSGQKLVAYGASDRFYYRMFNGSAPCTVGAFGGDPIVGVQKQCYVGN